MRSLRYGQPITGGLVVRAEGDGSRVIAGSFPYDGRPYVKSDGGNNGGVPVKERIRSGAFTHSIESSEQEINLLFGHDFNSPLASKLNGSLTISDDADAMRFEAKIAREVAEDTDHGRKALSLIGAGLSVGLSPGFRIPPKSAVEQPVTSEKEDPSEGRAVIENIHEAILREISVVTNPAYKDATVEARSDDQAGPSTIVRVTRFMGAYR